LWLSLFNALPQTRTFVARRRGEVLATLTLVVDSELGLPMDCQFSRQLAPFRVVGEHLAEVTSLAVAAHLGREGVKVVLELFQSLGLYLRHEAPVDRLCITINPHHRAYYEKKLRFTTTLGLAESYKRVDGAPAVALAGRADAIVDRALTLPMSPRLKEQEAKLAQGSKASEPFRWSRECFYYFFVEKTALLNKVSTEALRQLRGYYPEFDWNALLPEAMPYAA